MPHQSSTHGDTNIVAASIERSWSKDLLIYFVFFLSGAAALVYEISWTRQIGLLFGHTVHAASIVLASYFAGMAIGYLLGANWSSRISPLKGYAVAEVVVAAWAFVIPAILQLSESSMIAPWFSHSSFALQTATRAVFSFLLLLPATIALGVTLPMMASYFSGNNPGQLSNVHNSSRVTLAYALNTAGALLGVLAATFFMLVVVGVRTSSYVAAGLSVLCALAALLLARKETRAVRLNSELSTVNSEPSTLNSGLSTLAFLSGFGILALQVLYTRMFSLVFHNSTYTFGIVVAVFLASLAIGAAITSRLLGRFAANRLVGVTTGLGALATAGSVVVFVSITDMKYFSSGDSFVQYMVGAILLVSVVVAPAITCLGMMLPQVWVMAAQSGTAARVVGNLTAVNTMAAALGALVASFAFLIWIGLWQSIVLIAALFLIAALVLLWRVKQTKIAAVISVLTAAVSVISWQSPIESEFNRREYHEQLVKRWNSSYGWIDVVQNEKTGSFKIRQNLHYRFGKTGSNVREYRQAHIPILLHDSPDEVLFLGLGTGLTAGGAIPHSDVENIVAVELIPEVVDAVRMLSKYNYNVVDDPKVDIQIDDARHYLLANEKKFDVIISDLFVPWESETGYLYTVEHYEIALQRLKPDGLFCQWLPLYQLGEREFESIANSFASVFPHTTIWWGQLETTSPVVALIGSRSSIDVDPIKLAQRLDSLNTNATTPDQSIATPERFWDHYIGDWQLQSNAQFNTDEHPRVEFLTPVSNRDGKMIKGKVLKQYFTDVLFNLPMNSARLQGEKSQDALRRRSAQKLILFGR
jgi:spermidine synthase